MNSLRSLLTRLSARDLFKNASNKWVWKMIWEIGKLRKQVVVAT